MPAERKFSREALREMRDGRSVVDLAAHFDVAPSTITRALRQIDSEDYAAGRRERPPEVELLRLRVDDDRTTPPLPGEPDRYDVYAGVLSNIRELEKQLAKDISHQERTRYLSQLRANQETLLRLQASTVREDAAEALYDIVLSVAAECLDDENLGRFVSGLRDRRDLRRADRGV